ncbi:MAG: MarC family protein [Pseudomonadota bacterium]
MEWNIIVREFVTLWVVIDPIGTIPVFLAVTVGLETAQRNAIALQSTLIATGILLFFIFVGQRLLEAMAIHLEAFQIAGGLVLFIFAMTMIFGESKPEQETQEVHGDMHHKVVFPLAVPSLASPGAMLSAVMLTDNHRYALTEQTITAGIMALVMLCALLLLLMAGPILRVIGMAGASVVSRVMGLILASVAVDNILHATVTFFGIPVPP